MVQAMVAAGVIGGMALVVSQLGKQSTQIQRAASTDMALSELSAQVQSNLLSQAACTNTFQALAVAPNTANASFTAIKDKLNNDAYIIGKDYINNQARIVRIELSRVAGDRNLTIDYERSGNTNKRGVGVATLRKKYLIHAEWSGNDLTKCYADTSVSVAQTVEDAIEAACSNLGNGLRVVDGKCELVAQVGTSAIAPAPATPADIEICPSDDPEQNTHAYNGFTNVTTITPADPGYYKPNCVKLADIPKCNLNEALYKGSDGIIKCVSLSCPGGIFQGMYSDGTPRCIPCGNGQVPFKTSSGAITCVNVACNNSKTKAQEYFMGFNPSSGNSICNPLLDQSLNPSCPNGTGRLVATPTGSVKLECCTPICNNSSNHCSGAVFSSANGCGTCSGTKAPDCSDAGNHCSGTLFTSPNDCGNCVGTKSPVNATWSAWTTANEVRDKAGATCVSGSFAQEKKFTRVCMNNQACGGAAGCSGASEEWRDGFTRSCAAACTPSCHVPSSAVCRGLTYTYDDGCSGRCTVTGTHANYAPGPSCLYSPDDVLGECDPTQTCAEKQALVCVGVLVRGTDSCGNVCGTGTKTVGCSGGTSGGTTGGGGCTACGGNTIPFQCPEDPCPQCVPRNPVGLTPMPACR